MCQVEALRNELAVLHRASREQEEVFKALKFESAEALEHARLRAAVEFKAIAVAAADKEAEAMKRLRVQCALEGTTKECAQRAAAAMKETQTMSSAMRADLATSQKRVREIAEALSAEFEKLAASVKSPPLSPFFTFERACPSSTRS